MGFWSLFRLVEKNHFNWKSLRGVCNLQQSQFLGYRLTEGLTNSTNYHCADMYHYSLWEGRLRNRTFLIETIQKISIGQIGSEWCRICRHLTFFNLMRKVLIQNKSRFVHDRIETQAVLLPPLRVKSCNIIENCRGVLNHFSTSVHQMSWFHDNNDKHTYRIRFIELHIRI